ncbi:HNH endonuclease [Antarcticirhabdus aurantiaca]|uniref:HNH endonuclease signature motif containing protein n=1 Tax=Antarcticirhabdus aurantiaca TaxID=2606717 RepID=A0ACD4NK47_9HYPH|nr:HNH endonuclease signature motif containing protein [Antarcticirhabdus aurantiaca]WAJ27156.1 HNH endonuclease signature motif containing protein [Jeongeuplla avenae]
MSTPMIDNPLGGRAVPEWIGAHPDAKVPDKVRDRILARAEGRCHISGIEIRGKDWELEHIKPLSMGGEHRETNLAPALAEPHRAKTAAEAAGRAKADRIRRKLNGTWPKTKHPLRSRGFSKRENGYR